MPAARVGWLVARARAVAGITDRDLASSLGLPLRAIRRWERGDVVPTDDEVEAIAAACGARLTELLPRRASVSYDPATGIMRMGDQAVALAANMVDNDTVLGAYIGMVRRQRGLRPDQDVKVRQEDLESLGEALDLDDEELEERLVRVIGMSRTQAAAVRAQLLRRRLAVPMVGMLAGLSLLGVNRLFTTATEQVKTVAGGAITRGNPFADLPTTTATTVIQSVTIELAPSTTTPAPTASPTLPPVVTDVAVTVGPTQPSRTGPPRSTRRQPTTDATDPPATDPAPAETAPPGTSASTAAPVTTTPTPAPTPAPPGTPAPIGTPVVQETTTAAPPTTTTTTTPSNPTPTTSTTTPVTTVGGGNTSGTTDPPTTTTTVAGNPPLSPVETSPGSA